MDKTILVISVSKLIETFSSQALASLLDIDKENSKTLSNKSSAFSFKQKLDLLTDIKTFDKKHLQKFQIFTEIRNQFAHNFAVNNFEDCFPFLDGSENYLRKQYPEISEEGKKREDYLFELYKKLFSDILNTCTDIINAIEKKIAKEAGDEVTKEIYEELIMEIKEYASKNPEFNDYYNELVDNITNKRIIE